MDPDPTARVSRAVGSGSTLFATHQETRLMWFKWKKLSVYQDSVAKSRRKLTVCLVSSGSAVCESKKSKASVETAQSGLKFCCLHTSTKVHLATTRIRPIFSQRGSNRYRSCLMATSADLTHACTHTCMPTRVDLDVHTQMQARTNTQRTHMHKHVCASTDIHSYMRLHKRPCTHKHARVRAWTYTLTHE